MPTRPVAPAPFVVAVDPGHGGSYSAAYPHQPWDPGAISPINGLMERVVTLAVGLDLRTLLQEQGVQVVMTRTRNVFVSIPQRMATAVAHHAQLFISIHFNYFPQPQVEGLTVLYPDAGSRSFAQAVDTAVASQLAPYQVANRGLMAFPQLWVKAPMPVVTVESAYVTNPHDAQLLQTATFREAIAQGILSGILAYAPQIRQHQAAMQRYRVALARYRHALVRREALLGRERLMALRTTRADRVTLPLLLSVVIATLLLYRRFLVGLGRRPWAGRRRRAARSPAVPRQRLSLLRLRAFPDVRRPRHPRATPPVRGLGGRQPAPPVWQVATLRSRVRRSTPVTRRASVPPGRSGGRGSTVVASRGASTTLRWRRPAAAAPRQRFVAEMVEPGATVRHRHTVYDELWF